MKNEKREQVELSRRAFLAATGKLVGLGILTHITMLGKVEAASVSPVVLCNLTAHNDCSSTDKYYSCNETNKHSCASKFNCMTRFTCTPNSTNDCKGYSQNNCNPTSLFHQTE